jgi:acylaminoacyl-peptidase
MGTATTLDEIHVSHISPRRVLKLTDFNGPLLAQLDLAKSDATWVKSTDGARVQTWMLKPPNAKRSKKYPAVLEIHGGPHAMYGVGYFHEFQLLAAQGYVVFFSNPRGSKGYGRDFCAAIQGSWGGKDWDDIQAVTKFMKSHRTVNARRMGIMGGSYGGYMTNWAIGHTNEFAGAITDRCVSNLISMAGNSDYADEPDRYFPGNWWDNIEGRWNQSPLKYFGNVKTPTLIIHSEGDLRCNVEQSEQVFTTLKFLKVPARFVRYPSSTSHGMSRSGPPDLRVHRLNQIVAWWKRWL